MNLSLQTFPKLSALRLFFYFGIACLFAGCSRETPTAVPLEAPVRVISVDPVSDYSSIIATGLVRVALEAPLSFKTPGIIAEILVDSGQRVKSGQVLAALVMTDLDAQRTQAQEQVAKAERDLARAESLRAKGMVSQQIEQDARAQREIARAALTAAIFNSEQAVITAPFDGLILDKRADAHETVAAGQPVILFGRLDKGWVVRAGLSAKDAVQVNVGDPVRVQLDTASAEATALEATVKRVAAASDPRTGSIEVEVLLPATKERLLSGMVARLEFSKPAAAQAEQRPRVLLPLNAVLEGSDGQAKVFVLDASKKKVQRIEVRTGLLLPGGIEIIDGLPAGAAVVSEGAAWLSDGDAVRIMP